jgi:hypothetical protein
MACLAPVEDRKQKAKSREQKATIKKQRAESREQRSESREQRAESRKQRAESREQRAESREQRAESRGDWNRTSAGTAARPAPAGAPIDGACTIFCLKMLRTFLILALPSPRS